MASASKAIISNTPQLKSTEVAITPSSTAPRLGFQLPDPDDESITDHDFQAQVDYAWQTCDQLNLQTDIWRGRILRVVRDREKKRDDGRGTGFLKWLADHEISKSQAYSWLEMAASADTLAATGQLDTETVERFSKRAFVETARATPEVQQLVTDAARSGSHITRREVRQLADEWTAMTSDLLPEPVKERAAASVIPTRYLAPLVREMEKLPTVHQVVIQEAIANTPDVETVKQATTDARRLAKYLANSSHVQALDHPQLDIEAALEEALRLDCLPSAADLVTQAAQVEQLAAKLFTSWKRLQTLAERLYLDSGASTPHLRRMLSCLETLSGESIQLQLGHEDSTRTIYIHIQDDEVWSATVE